MELVKLVHLKLAEAGAYVVCSDLNEEKANLYS
mgnify:CR=1 FL=1